MKRESIGLCHITALSLIVAKVHSQSGEVSEMNKCYFLVEELAGRLLGNLSFRITQARMACHDLIPNMCRYKKRYCVLMKYVILKYFC